MTMFNPISTYRIQFHKDFNFKKFDAIIPYLQKLGLKTIYASPIFEAVPGSMHGYDVVNPDRVNPEIGTEEELRELSKKLKSLGINWLQDIVPNHMAFHPANNWLMDVLEKGRQSVYSLFFDVTWTSALFHGRLMVPFLSGTIEEAIQNKEIKIEFRQRLMITYSDQRYPLHPRSYKTILQCVKKSSDEVKVLIDQISEIHSITDPVIYSFRWHEFLLQLESFIKTDPEDLLADCLQNVNNDPQKILEIAEAQVYRLCSWQETDQKINFRRFFTVNGLICLNMQVKTVFDHYHKKIKSLLDEGIIQGIRVDHIDGLYDPAGYLNQLRQLVGDDTYIVVEKILEPGEQLPSSWPIQGTTGYDFLGLVNNVFTRNNTVNRFSAFYNTLVHDKRSTHEKISEKKANILFNHMGGELENLYQLFLELNLASKEELDQLKQDELKNAIAEFLIQFPVYRYYGNQIPFSGDEHKGIADLFKQSQKIKPALGSAINLLDKALLVNTKNQDTDYNSRALRFYQRCMQFTGPLMAKGVEDTLMYTFNRFVGHNEVGDSPEYFGLTTEEFHQKMSGRQKESPLAMNATSTHDTKRGEDVRTRLNVLPELADEWITLVQEWQELNKDIKKENSPDANDEYFIYQTLLGAYPMQEESDFIPRIEEYLTKALREGKLHSDWATPNEQYEEATKNFVRELLNPKRKFFKSFIAFQKKVSDYGIVNSLSQVLLKFTCPGIPDNYQGTASWDLSLVDPDNRRPIDYEQREQWLNELITKCDSETFISNLWNERHDSRIKLWLVHTLLLCRTKYNDVFTKGLYIPLTVKGRYKDNIVAFARRFGNTWLITAIPLYTARLSQLQKKEINKLNWRDTSIILPEDAPDEWEDLITHQKGKFSKEILIKDLFKDIPFAFLKLEKPKSDRGAGVLLSITSLPSAFGIGDFGKEAKQFAEFLSNSKQTYWQILPLNPTTKESGHSPYSSFSSMAGNSVLISPEELVEQGLLTDQQLKEHTLTNSNQVDSNEVFEHKTALLEEACSNFKSKSNSDQEFISFQKKENYWLNDFALYVVLKNNFLGKPWYEWPDEFRLRNSSALEEFSKQNEEGLLKAKWFQFLFFKQWHELKNHCQVLGVKLFGDLPFYVSYDSVDVWAHPDIFSLDEEGKMKGIAGVPPDYFNSDGQLWGMPVFCWDVLMKQNYDWWIKRIRRNLELFDVLRFDHFRAFADFWNVPAGETTAVNGVWEDGPGSDFFQHLKTEFPELPFIAEDLGDVSPAVYRLRDEFNLPGMKVLQFAFDEINSPFLPHNYTSNFVVYTGTHDNNTTRGWYREALKKEDRVRIEKYIGQKINEKSISDALIRLAYSSVANTAIIPLQDILNLDEHSRINTPSIAEGNWKWRLKENWCNDSMAEKLRSLVNTYNR